MMNRTLERVVTANNGDPMPSRKGAVSETDLGRKNIGASATLAKDNRWHGGPGV